MTARNGAPVQYRGARRATAAYLLSAALTAAAVSSCASVPTAAPADPARAAAGTVAVQYATDIMTGHWKQAERLVLPADRGTLQVLQAVSPPGHGSVQNLAVGSTTESGESMTVVLTGTICPVGSQPASANCLTNTDPAGRSPEFTVRLFRQAGTWVVYFPQPSIAPSSGAPGATASIKASP